MPERSRATALLSVGAAVVALDQWSKAAIVSAIGPGHGASRIDLLGRWLTFEYVENRGVAFGLFSNLGSLVPFVSLLVLAVLLVRYFRAPTASPWEAVGIGAIAGGAVGNLIDRIRFGYVVDFVSIGRWPNFNVADSAITIGVGLVIWCWLAADGQRETVWT